MGRKQQKQRGIPKADKNKDALHRMNFLYQAALLMTETGAAARGAGYIYQTKQISQKLVLRMDIAVKRTICKRCSRLLVPGLTSSVEIADDSLTRTDQCNNCDTKKVFPLLH